MKKKLGLDIDGVIADSQEVIIEHLNLIFDKNYKRGDFFNFDPARMFGVDRHTVDRLIMERELDIIKRVKPINGAAETIDKLREVFSIHLISARTPSFYHSTLDWLEMHSVKCDNLILLGHHDKRQSCLDEGVILFVEDNKKNAYQINTCGIPVYLFDATYNQGELPESIQRVYNWEELFNYILKDFCLDKAGTSA
ncbi:HAD-superfamily hydrolase-like protein [Desulfocucumis palustris]|uniref:Nucleotidase n=1 Tax=Desulfocucumis palustris TaxID=1898651 RepID=A0A2L2XG16_9FIRM|nr:hypothetical protein [Desulfocucumis palustris]GBF34944.1 HAD-superfamily hydrolase-like protein [Desulfocucumis palustris]